MELNIHRHSTGAAELGGPPDAIVATASVRTLGGTESTSQHARGGAVPTAGGVPHGTDTTIFGNAVSTFASVVLRPLSTEHAFVEVPVLRGQ